MYHLQVRTKITLFLARHEKRFAPFFYPEEIPGANIIPKDFTEYVEILTQDGVYGGALEITAAPEIWSIGIWVFNETEKLHSVWDVLNESFICLRYALRRKHYELIEVLGKKAYQILLLNRDRRRKTLSNQNVPIDLTTPIASNKDTPLSIQSPETPKASIKVYASPKDKYTAKGISKWFPLPRHDTALRQSGSQLLYPSQMIISGDSTTPLHFERSETPSKPTKAVESLENLEDQFITGVKSSKGKKRRTIFNLMRKYFRKLRVLKIIKNKNKKKGLWKDVCNLRSHVITTKSGYALLPVNKDSFSGSSVFNFSSKFLTPAEEKLFVKGLSFCPATSVINQAQIQIDIFKFYRNIRLKKYFETHPPNNSFLQKHVLDHSFKFNPESTFDPETTCKFLNTYFESVKSGILSLTKKKVYATDNLDPLERAVLASLRLQIKNKEISVVLADKGGGAVILDFSTYKSRGDLYFTDNKDSYSLINDPETKVLKLLLKARTKVVQQLLDSRVINNKHKKFIEKKLYTKITGIKFLFKIHKSMDMEAIPLRPIYPSKGSPNHNLSMLLDGLISPLVDSRFIPTLLRDTNQLLYFLRNLEPLPPNIIIATSDITSLYTNIPHDVGVSVLISFLTKFSNYSTEGIEAIANAVMHVVSLNYLRWQDLIYQQTKGVAMGTPLAVSYANIFMGAVDEALAIKAPFIIKHFRFINDNFFLVPKDRVWELQQASVIPEFPTIHSTWQVDYNNDGISFLDALITLKGGVAHTRLFTKPTDKHFYLRPLSYHPRHMLSNILYSILSRIRRSCSDEETYEEDKSKALQWLADRGYSEAVLKETVTKVDSQSGYQHIVAIENKHKSKLYKKVGTAQQDAIIPLILTYSPKLKKALALIYKHRYTISASFKQPHRALVAFRRSKNLTDLLVHPSYRQHIQSNVEPKDREEGFHHCCRKLHYKLKTCICGIVHLEGCRVCAHSVDRLSRLPKTRVKILLGQSADCHTKNVVYAIWCRVCAKIYVGETTQPLSSRLDQHLRLMRTRTSTEALYQHFRAHHPSNAFIVPLEVVRKLEPKLLQIKESIWINKLGTIILNGLNTQLYLDQRYVGIPNVRLKDHTVDTPTPERAFVNPNTFSPFVKTLSPKKKLKRKTDHSGRKLPQEQGQREIPIATPKAAFKHKGTTKLNISEIKP